MYLFWCNGFLGCKQAALRFFDHGEICCILFAVKWRISKKKECIFRVVFVLLQFHQILQLQLLARCFFWYLITIDPSQPQENTPVLLQLWPVCCQKVPIICAKNFLDVQKISSHKYFNATNVSGKTYIRRVIRGLSKINGAQFLCHFSPTKPFDKMEEFGNWTLEQYKAACCYLEFKPDFYNIKIPTHKLGIVETWEVNGFGNLTWYMVTCLVLSGFWFSVSFICFLFFLSFLFGTFFIIALFVDVVVSLSPLTFLRLVLVSGKFIVII